MTRTVGEELEQERLGVLRRYQILDTPPERAFDRISRIAARLFGVPIVLISLVDESPKWFRSCYGMDAREPNLSALFCKYALEQEGVLVVPDVTQDARFRKIATIAGEPCVRFYAGAPLRTKDGFRLGTLCLIDQLPHAALTSEEHTILQDLAAMVINEFEAGLANEALRQSEEQLFFQASILKQVHNAVIATTPKGRITYWNKAAEDFYGYTEQEALGQPVEDVMVALAGEALPNEIRNATKNAGQWEGEVADRRADGTLIPFLTTVAPLYDRHGNLSGYVGVKTDISELKAKECALVEAEQEVRQSEARFKSLVQNSYDMISLLASDGTILYESPAIYRMLGYTSEELVGQNAFSFVHPDDMPVVLECFQKVVAEGIPQTLEFRFKHKESEWRWLECTGINLLNDPSVGAVVANLRDVTERRVAKDAVRASEERYRKLFMDAPIGIYRTTPQGRIIMANPAMQRLLGYQSFEELTASDLEAKARSTGYARQEFKARVEKDELLGHEAIWHKADGTPVHVRENARTVRDEQGNVLYYEGTVEDITERKQVEETVRRWQEHYELALRSANAGTWEVNLQTQETVWSRETYEFYGIDPSVKPSSEVWEALLTPQDLQEDRQRMAEILTERLEYFENEYRVVHPQHGTRWIQTRGRVTYAPDGTPLHMYGVNMDVTERKQNETARKESQQHLQRLAEFRRSIMELVEENLGEGQEGAFYSRLLERAVDVIPGVQAGSLIVQAPDGFYGYAAAVNYDFASLRHVRYSRDQVTYGRRHATPYLITEFDDAGLSKEEAEILQTAGRVNEIMVTLLVPIELGNNTAAYMMLDNFDSKDAFNDEAVEMARIFAGHAASLLKRISLEQKLHRMAYQDPLTELPNRAMFKQNLQETLLKAELEGSNVAVLFVDLDNLKHINDSLGHKVGDEALRVVAERLKRCTRTTDMVARLSGDEFTLILPSAHARHDAQQVAERLLGLLAEPIRTHDHNVRTSASIGISVYPSDGRTAADLLQHADIAMYHSKQRGKNSFSFFTPEMKAAPLERLLLEEALRKALAQDELLLHYQPRVDFETGSITSLEALVRWQHPERGLIPPGLFIPLAENTSIIHPLGRRVMEMACHQAKVWHDHGHRDFRVAVNLSAKQLQRPDIVDELQDVLIKTGLPGTMLEIEVLESAAMTDVSGNGRKLRALKALGIRIALDDFGTGYSSLSQLRDLPVDAIKIDRSFLEGIRSAENLENNLAIIRAITALAHNLELAVVAEGIEEQIQWNLLKEVGCDEAQGYLLSRPVPSSKAEEFFKQNMIPLQLKQVSP